MRTAREPLLIDVDGVIADPIRQFVTYVQNEYSDVLEEKGLAPFVYEDVNSWGFGDTFAAIGNEPSEGIEILDEIWETAWENIPPVQDDVADHIAALQETYRVDIVTARTQEKEVTQWLDLHNIPYDSLDFIQQKQHLPYRYFFEDNPELPSRIAVSSVMPEQYVFLFDRPWNQNMEEQMHVRRVADWEHALTELNRIDRSH